MAQRNGVCDQKGELPMPTQEERFTALEQTLAFLQRKSGVEIQDLNRNVTMLLGVASGQELDIKEIKISLVTVRDRLDVVEQRLGAIEQGLDVVEQRLGAIEQGLESRFETVDKKFDQMLSLLTTFTARPEQET